MSNLEAIHSHFTTDREVPVSVPLARRDVSAHVEMGAYEWLWLHSAHTPEGIAEVFRHAPGALPSDLVEPGHALDTARTILTQLARAGVTAFGIRVNGTADYPQRLRDTSNPPELVYYQGWWDLVDAPRRVAVVGSREVTDKGARRTRKLVQMLVERRCTIAAALERGVGAIAHETAIRAGGATIAVSAHPLSHHDPKLDNRIQRKIATEHLLISPVPELRYTKQDARANRMFVAERGSVMSALTDATIIVEAGAISSSVSQGDLALRQGRKVFILNGCFDQAGISWPAKLEARGAVRIREFEQIIRALRA